MAKRFANLYPTVCAFENLWYAYKAAVRGKRAKLAVARFEFHVEERLLELEWQLREKTYRPGAYRSFYIRDPKRRLISAAPFRDRHLVPRLSALSGPTPAEAAQWRAVRAAATAHRPRLRQGPGEPASGMGLLSWMGSARRAWGHQRAAGCLARPGGHSSDA